MNKVEEALHWIKFVLIRDYRVSEGQAEKIINNSKIKEFFKEDVETAYHTSIEEWAKLCYQWTEFCSQWRINTDLI